MYKRNWVARITVDGFETKCFFYGTEKRLYRLKKTERKRF